MFESKSKRMMKRTFSKILKVFSIFFIVLDIGMDQIILVYIRTGMSVIMSLSHDDSSVK